MKTISCKVKDETYNDLQELAQNSDVTISEWIRDMIENEFEEMEKECKANEEDEQKPVEAEITQISNDGGKTWIKIDNSES